MTNITELLDQLMLTRYDIGSSHWVHVTHINSPDSFYVRPAISTQYLSTLQEYTNKIEISQTSLRDIVIFKSSLKSKHVRGQICNIEDCNGQILYDIFALDYGFIEQAVLSENIFQPNTSASCISALSLHCQLADCKPINNQPNFSKKSIDAMIFYVGKERAKMIVKGKSSDKLIVQLINTCPEDISTMMALTGYATLGYAENKIVSRMSELEQSKLLYKYKELHVGDELHVCVQSGTSLKSFYVCDVKDYKKYVLERGNFTNYSKKQKELNGKDLVKGKPVGVFTNLKYERAIIKEVTIPERQAVVQLVDWGSTILTDIFNLTPITSDFFFINPAVAIYCSAEEEQAWDNGLQQFLYPGYEFMITIKEVGKSFDVPNIVNLSRLEK